MIPDRLIDQGTLTSDGARVAIDVRIPWYRALPASCIGGATLTVDGAEVPASSLRWEMNGNTFTFEQMKNNTHEWWFPADSAVLSGDLPLDADDREHSIKVSLTLFLPYLIIGDEVLEITESDTKMMKAAAA
ncbi:C-glycoside deglycosidase beta subunit domain-containing protein [Microbacterium sp. 22215]|uniref:C-glycoside deglycosidase beta subunit domain-containing protein n=1 Tax=Microbacterium sp. 22215 TaxID=3453893 RepID=UPI003F83EE29